MFQVLQIDNLREGLEKKDMNVEMNNKEKEKKKEMPSGSMEVTAEEIWREREEAGRRRRRMKKRGGRRDCCGEKLVCGWNGEMIVRWIWSEARGGACQNERMDGWMSG